MILAFYSGAIYVIYLSNANLILKIVFKAAFTEIMAANQIHNLLYFNIRIAYITVKGFGISIYQFNI